MRSSRLVFLALAAATLTLGAVVVGPRVADPPTATRGPAVATLPPGWFAYRPPGDFEADGQTIDAPARATRFDAPLDVMVEPVSQADYARCAAAGACPKVKGVDPAAADLPVVGVSYPDATAYAGVALARERRRLAAAERRRMGLRRGRTLSQGLARHGRRRLRAPLAGQVRRRIASGGPAEGAAAVRPLRPQCARRRRPRRQRLGMDGSCYERARSSRTGGPAPADAQLSRARARRRAPHVHERLHPRRRRRRLLGRPAADQSRLPSGARSDERRRTGDEQRRRAVCGAVMQFVIASEAKQSRML